ncbi:MAG: DUF389 domain-containing protein, partial [Gemmatimonadales bacterium]|nr:DUF389 domain-containing protein [Gemmatimonadales bacterium]
MSTWRERLREYAGLTDGTDVEGTIARARADAELRGANLWLLACSAVLASIGLDTNSTAVIIGAMLISPLMGPIVAIGLAVAIDDKALLKQGLLAFGLAMVLALATSFAYFVVTPLGEVTSEMRARTVPTLLDVGIAFFGGLAGIVSGSRRERTIAIPGVAIATALMPPLCTAGFGLATGDLRFFGGAFYLFFINAVFISLATFIVARALRFPLRRQATPDMQRSVTRWVAAFALLVTLPSGWLLYTLVNDARRTQRIGAFVRQHVASPEHDAIQWRVVRRDSANELTVYLIGAPLTGLELAAAEQALAADRRIGDLRLRVVQTALTPEDRQAVSSEAALAALAALERRDAEGAAAAAAAPRDPLRPGPVDTASARQIRSEVLALFREVEDVEVGAVVRSADGATVPSALV